ncbi:MAG TPA: hypothetical protein EYQ64_04010, partial [Gemmatimonadetes bacterium]|nr:hypothetical protein [Gemmatimonadota bacterium]
MPTDQLVVVNNPAFAQVLKHLRQRAFDVHRRVLVQANLDVQAHPVGAKDVVVETDPVKTLVAFGNVDPVVAVWSLLVEPQVEDQHLVPSVQRRVVLHATRRQRARKWRRADQVLEPQLKGAIPLLHG